MVNQAHRVPSHFSSQRGSLVQWSLWTQ